MTGQVLKLRRPLWDHQRECLDKMAGKEAFAVLMAMRLGKTATILVDYARLEAAGEVENLFVLAPGGAYRTWEEAASDDLPLSLYERLTTHIWQSGGGATKERSRKGFLEAVGGPRMLVMNIEALSTVEDARTLATAFLGQGPGMLVVDESTVLRDPSSKRTKFVVDKLAPLAPYRRILSGLPSPNSPFNLFAQFCFLDWRILGHDSFFTFKAYYARMARVRLPNGHTFWEVKNYRNLEDLQRKIEPHSYRKRLEDVYDMPPKLYSYRHVELTKEQVRIYDELLAFATAKLTATEHVTATIVIVQLIRLHQVLCGYSVDELGKVHPIPENRTSALLELLREFEGKAIVWVSYDYNIRAVADAIRGEYGPGSVARFWGGNRETREEEERRYKTDPECRFMVATPAAGGRGRTWTAADLVVYFSNSYDLEHRSQSEERPQGVGKTRSVAYVDLVAKGTVDERIIKALREKIVLASAITGDNWKEWLA
jgi:hypothetical protein